MTIIEKIKQSIETATGLPFIYHAAGEINELLTKAKSLPIAYSFLIDSGTVQSVNGNYHEQITLAVMFCDKTEFDFNAIENEQIIDTMKVKAYKWLQSLRDNSNALRIVSVNSTQRLYDNTTAILTGYAVNITLQDTSGEGDCTLPDVVIPIESNGEYNVVGVDKVDVNVVPKLQELEVTENGEYLPPTDIAGFSKVNVNVQPVLEELTITENGTYTPSEGVDGFRKVVAEFDTSSLPKAKFSNFSITNECIPDNGIWDGSFIDTSKCIGFSFKSCSSMKIARIENWDVRNIQRGYLNEAFFWCTNLEYLDTSNWEITNKVYDLFRTFKTCRKLRYMDTTRWDMSGLNKLQQTFSECSSLSSIIGNRTIDDVLNNNISCLNGIKVYGYFNETILDRASLRALINGLADLTGQTAQTLSLGTTLMAKLTEEDIAIATNKNWTIA